MPRKPMTKALSAQPIDKIVEAVKAVDPMKVKKSLVTNFKISNITIAP